MNEATLRYVNLGRTALRVSRFCLGTMNFGAYTDEATSGEIMDRALEAGINFFDTANVYGGSAGRGASEEIVGRWFAGGGGRREQVVLATKVFGAMGPGPNDGKLSARHIVMACNESLQRLQTDWIDIYQMHHVWREAPWEEIWQAMERLVSQGKVLYVGSSNFAGWHLALAQGEAARRNVLGLVSEQSLYNLLSRTVELEVIPACRHLGLGVIPWSPLGGGLLGGILAGEDQGVRRSRRGLQERLERHRPAIQAFETHCRTLGQGPALVALAWLLGREGVTAPIIGPRTPGQLDDVLPALDVTLDPATLETLDQIFPGPGGPAPEAYAW